MADERSKWPAKLVDWAGGGVVGGAAFALAGAGVTVLLGLLGGDVPAWTLGLALLVVMALAAAVVVGLLRRYEHVRGERDEARRQLADAQGTVDQLQGQVQAQAQAGSGDDVPISPRAQGFVRRIRALAQSVEDDDREYAHDSELLLAQGIIRDMRGATGGSDSLSVVARSIDTITRLPRSTLIAALGQLEALALELGVEDLTPTR